MTAEEFRTEIRLQIERAKGQGRPYHEINAGELHRTLSLGENVPNRVPVCCDVMHQEAKLTRSEIVYQTPSGHSSSLTIRYYFS
jgi:hypothetical protein